MSIHSKFLVHWTGKDIENPQQYLERLKDDYQNGLYLRRCEEDVLRKLKIERLLRLCFTEIRLSQAQKHAERYGMLGIGFSRDFILTRGGRPVIYIPFNPQNALLEDSLRTIYDYSTDHQEILRPVEWVLSFIKRMSNENNEDFYEEMEWRVVYDENPENQFFKRGDREDVYRLVFAPDDVKVLVFPNEEIKQMVLNDDMMKEIFSRHMPIIVTLDDCNNF